MPSHTPENETKEDKSLRLAAARMEMALDKIRLIGNLAGPSYVLATAHVEQMESALTNAVTTALNKLRHVEEVKTAGFTFVKPVTAEVPAEQTGSEDAGEQTGDPAPEGEVVGEVEVAARRSRRA